MRDFARKSPTFWTRGTGKRLRGHKDAQILVDYLTSSPTHNAIGLYSVGLPNICHETGLALDEVVAAFALLERLEFALYDREEEVVWIKTMVLWQFGIEPDETLKPGDHATKGDNKIKAIAKDLINAPRHPFVRLFYDLYETRLCILPRPEWVKKLTPWQGGKLPPSKGVHSASESPSQGGQVGANAHSDPPFRATSNSNSKGNSEATAEAGDGIPAAVLKELRAHQSLRSVASPEMAKALADRFTVNEVQKRMQFAWVIDSIRECATDVAAAGLMPEALGRKLRSYCDHAKRPRDSTEQSPEDKRSARMAAAQASEMGKADGSGQ